MLTDHPTNNEKIAMSNFSRFGGGRVASEKNVNDDFVSVSGKGDFKDMMVSGEFINQWYYLAGFKMAGDFHSDEYMNKPTVALLGTSNYVCVK